jgi:hypothetical protein
MYILKANDTILSTIIDKKKSGGEFEMDLKKCMKKQIENTNGSYCSFQWNGDDFVVETQGEYF